MSTPKKTARIEPKKNMEELLSGTVNVIQIAIIAASVHRLHRSRVTLSLPATSFYLKFHFRIRIVSMFNWLLFFFVVAVVVSIVIHSSANLKMFN